MKIPIAQRLHPFSHAAGTQFLVPRTSLAVQIFPTRLNFSDLEGRLEPFFLTLDFSGPIQGFTAEVDLERGLLSVFGMTQTGYMRYQLCAREGSLLLTMEKTPGERVVCRHSRCAEEISFQRGESKSVCPSLKNIVEIVPQERLSLGMHRAQDWDLVRRRLECKEIFPFWLSMANHTPAAENIVEEASLLNACKNKIEQRQRESVLEAFEHLFLAAFEGVLTPRWVDSDYQGIGSQFPTTAPSISSLPLLTQSGQLIRSLFIEESSGEVSLLPCLPPQFHCGRMIRVRTSRGEVLDFEWTKKTLRSVLIHSASGGPLTLKFPKGIRSFRATCGKQVLKKVNVDAEGRAALSLEAGKTLQLDRLEH
jgi:hypothetical protein